MGPAEPAIRVVGSIDSDGAIRLAEELSALSDDGKKVLDLLKSVRKIGHSDLLRRLSYRLNAKQLKLVLDTLLELGGIVETSKAGAKYYQYVGRLKAAGAAVGCLSQQDLAKQEEKPVHIGEDRLWAFQGRCVVVDGESVPEPKALELEIKKAVYQDILDARDSEQKLQQQVERLEKRVGNLGARTQKSTDRASSEHLEVQRRSEIFSHIRGIWLKGIPEELVRQEFVGTLVKEYGYSLDQMAEELTVPEPGAGQARADIVLWRSVEDKEKKESPGIVVECKADEKPIRSPGRQAKNYARLTVARYLVAHNERQTKCWRVSHRKMEVELREAEDIPKAEALKVEFLESRLMETIGRKDSPWPEKVKAKLELHKVKCNQHGAAVKGHGGGWSLGDTARQIGEAISTVAEDIKLAKVIARYPQLASAKNKLTALGEYQRMVDERIIERLPPLGFENAEDV